MEVTCVQCGKGFRAKPREKRRYCSSECYHAAGRNQDRVERIHFTCKVCDKPFSRQPGELRSYRAKFGKDPMYCSTKCGGIGRRYPDEMWNGTCVQCGKPMKLKRRPGGTILQNAKLCSTECRSLFRSLHANSGYAQGKPSRYTTKQGYIAIRKPAYVNGVGKARLVLEHRMVMEEHLGRPLLPAETVHHINGDRAFNDLSNLELFSSAHGPGQRVRDKVAFAIEMLTLYPNFAREAGFELTAISPR